MNNTRMRFGSLSKEKGVETKSRQGRACPSLATDFELDVLEGRIAAKNFAHRFAQASVKALGAQGLLHGLVASVGKPDRGGDGQMHFFHQDRVGHSPSLHCAA